jgi:NADP-dependent 3-hydroxy acid dehydrogenase YdfG
MDMTDTRTALVTGASAGIGRATAISFGELGWKVALGARRIDALGEAATAVTDAGGTAFAHVLDVTDPDSVEAFVTNATDVLGPIDVLVNNAGCAWPGDIAAIDADRLRDMLATNVLGALLPSQAIVARLLEADSPGDVVFISSDAVHDPRPGLVTYGATKAAVEHIARGLAYEVEGSGIRVSTVRVGPTITEFASGWGDPEQFGALVERWQHFGSQRHWGVMEPADVARAVVLAVTTPSGAHLDTIEVQPVAPRPPE